MLDDFGTVDWVEDTLFERARRLRETRRSARDNAQALRSASYTEFSRFLPNRAQISVWASTLLHATQSWLVITIVGLGIGVNAALVNVVTSWLTDLKFGYCRYSWWLNSKFCCWEIDPVGSSDEEGGGTGGGEGCQDWQDWSETFFGLGYLVYVAYACLFAFSAAYIVKKYAPYAAGSGISEIKCILAGFIMKGFLGAITLAIKSLTLVGAFRTQYTQLVAQAYLHRLWTASRHCIWPFSRERGTLCTCSLRNRGSSWRVLPTIQSVTR